MSQQTGDFPVSYNAQTVGNVSVTQNGLMTVFNSTCNPGSSEVLRLAAVCGGNYVMLGVMMPDSAGAVHIKKSYSKNALTGMGYTAPESFYLVRPNEAFSSNESVPPPETAEIAPQTGSKQPEAARPAQQSSGQQHNMKPTQKQLPVPERMPPFKLPPDRQTQPQTQTQAQPKVMSPNSDNPADKAASQAAPGSTEQDEAHAKPEAAPNEEPPENLEGWSKTDNAAALFRDPEFAQVCRSVKNALTKKTGETTLLAVPIAQDEPFPMMPVFCFGESGRIAGREYIIFKIKNGKLAL